MALFDGDLEHAISKSEVNRRHGERHIERHAIVEGC